MRKMLGAGFPTGPVETWSARIFRCRPHMPSVTAQNRAAYHHSSPKYCLRGYSLLHSSGLHKGCKIGVVIFGSEVQGSEGIA